MVFRLWIVTFAIMILSSLHELSRDEYIAFSKAIVTEKWVMRLEGIRKKGKNDLEFRSPEECVEKFS